MVVITKIIEVDSIILTLSIVFLTSSPEPKYSYTLKYWCNNILHLE